MGMKKGDSFMTQPPFEVLIALVFAFLLIGFMIAQSGGINSILNSLCEKVPELCTGSVSTVDYQIAKQSTDSLACAINTVLTGKQQCAQVKIGPITAQAVAAGGVTGAQTAAQAQAGSASITCDIKTGYPELEYEEGCGTANPLCYHENVWYVLDSDGQWKWKCPDCGENNYKPLLSLGLILNKVDDVHKEIRENLVKISATTTEERYINGLEVLKNAVLSDNYGKDDSIIVHHKYGTTAVSKLTGAGTSPYGLNPIYETHTNLGSTETLNRDNVGLILSMGLESASACKVSNFNLPESFAGFAGKAKEFMPVAGDPSFLAYYQRFPVGEDADWTDMAPWYRDIGKLMFAGMCVLDIYGAGKVGIAAVKGYTKDTGRRIMDSLGNKLRSIKNIFRSTDEATVAEAAAQAERLSAAAEAEALGLGGKTGGEAILQFMKQEKLNSGIVKYLKTKYPGRTAEVVFGEETLHMQSLINSGKVTEADYFVLKSGFLEEWNFIETGIGKPTSVDLMAMLADKSSPGLIEKLLGKATNPEFLSKFIKYVGADSVASYYLSVIDSKIGKFLISNPNSLVLGIPAKTFEQSNKEGNILGLQSNVIQKPQNIAYPDKQNLFQLGRPVVLMKEGTGNPPISFYLASPCMADLTIESRSISCGFYSYDSLRQEASCDNPSEDENSRWYTFLTGELPDCGSLAKGSSTVQNEYVFNRFKTQASSIAQNINNAGAYDGEVTVNGENRIKITDPIEGIDFYYDKDAQIIDYIGATIEQGNDFKHDVRSVKIFSDFVKANGAFSWNLNSRNDGRSLYFDPQWTESQYDSCLLQNVPQLIKTTSKGTVGFSCQKRKLNKDEIERFMTGEKEINPSGKEYLVCNAPKIRDKNEKNGDMFITEWRVYFDGDTGNFFGIYVSKDRYYFMFLDTNNDHKIDKFGQFYYFASTGTGDIEGGPKGVVPLSLCQQTIQYENFQYRIFIDKDFNGAVDGIASSDCNIPQAVTISVDKKGLTDENGNNYCYKSKSGAWGVASTIAMFGASAAAKAGPYGMAAGIGVDCGIAIMEIWNPGGIIKSTWPSGQ